MEKRSLRGHTVSVLIAALRSLEEAKTLWERHLLRSGEERARQAQEREWMERLQDEVRRRGLLGDHFILGVILGTLPWPL